MTGFEIYNKALLRLGYNQNTNDVLIERAPELINQIAKDLNIEKNFDFTEEITDDKDIIEALCCGTAMLLSLSESDGEKHRIFSEIYNSKRGKILSTSDRVIDKLPFAESGGE